jgi:outer membrane protein with beta-barrel domain
MRKFLLAASGILMITQSVIAQDSDNFDKKFRFGLRVAAQPTWLSSTDNTTTKNGTGFGFGFGLVTEFKLSDIVHFSTGIGGDFETGKIKYKQDIPGGYAPGYVLNSSGELRTPDDAKKNPAASDKSYLLNSRTLHTTYVTIPITLKLLTKEVSGFRYFGVFGGDLGIRVKAKADDDVSTYNASATPPFYTLTNTSVSNINVSKDATVVPLRFGLNVGAGAEYRISGSTSLFLSVNYFRSFTNTMRKESKYVTTGTDGNGNNIFLKQNLLANAVRINVGIMF